MVVTFFGEAGVYNAERQVVHFVGLYRHQNIRFCITKSALLTLTSRQSVDPAELLELFGRHRPTIEEIATAKLERNKSRPSKLDFVVLTAADAASEAD